MISAGVPFATASCQRACRTARYAPRPRARRTRRAAVEQQAVLGRRRGAGRDDLAVEPRGVHEVDRLAPHLRELRPRLRDLVSGISNASHCTAFAAAYSSNVSTRRATTPAGGGGGSASARARRRTGPCRGRARARAARSTRSGGSAELPTSHCVRGRPRSRSSAAHFFEHVVDLVGAAVAAAGRCSRSCRGPCRACSGRSRCARRAGRAGRTSSGIRRSRAAREEATLWPAAPWPSG